MNPKNEIQSHAFKTHRETNRSKNLNPLQIKNYLEDHSNFYNTKIDKIEFLKYYLEYAQKDLDDRHKNSNCNNPVCDDRLFFKTKKRAVDQLIETIHSKKIELKPDSEIDKITSEDLITIYKKLDEISIQLNNIGFGEEIIYESIEELKEATSFGKRKFAKYFMVTIKDLISERIIEESLVNPLLNSVKQMAKILGDSINFNLLR